MATEEEIVRRLREILAESDLNKTTTAIVRRRLEEELGIDLKDRKGFVREQVDLFLQSQQQVDENGAEEEEEVKEEEVDDVEEEGEEEGSSNGYKTRKKKKRGSV